MVIRNIFDNIVSNPPYQNSSNAAIYHLFQEYANNISDNNVFIYPADKWIKQAGRGKGLDEFSVKQIMSPELQEVVVYKDAKTVFPQSADIEGGVCLTRINNNYSHDYFLLDLIGWHYDISSRYTEKQTNHVIAFNHVVNNIMERNKHKALTKNRLCDIYGPSSYYKIPSSFITNMDSSKYIKYERGDIPDGMVKVLTNSTTGTGGRVEWFLIDKNLVPRNADKTGLYTVATSNRSTSGGGNRSQQARIYHPEEIFGDCRLRIASFDNEKEAENFYHWLGNPIIRCFCDSSTRRIKNYGVNVYLLDDYKNIEKEDIELLIIEEYGLSDWEIDFLKDCATRLGPYENSMG